MPSLVCLIVGILNLSRTSRVQLGTRMSESVEEMGCKGVVT